MDVCHLDLPSRYELAILPFQAFMEIVGEEAQREALASVFACLAPGGRFLCTLHNPAVRRAHVDGLLRSRYRATDLPAQRDDLIDELEVGRLPGVARVVFEPDADVTAALSPAAIDAEFDLGYHYKHVDTIFARVFG